MSEIKTLHDGSTIEVDPIKGGVEITFNIKGAKTFVTQLYHADSELLWFMNAISSVAAKTNEFEIEHPLRLVK